MVSRTVRLLREENKRLKQIVQMQQKVIEALKKEATLSGTKRIMPYQEN